MDVQLLACLKTDLAALPVIMTVKVSTGIVYMHAPVQICSAENKHETHFTHIYTRVHTHLLVVDTTCRCTDTQVCLRVGRFGTRTCAERELISLEQSHPLKL